MGFFGKLGKLVMDVVETPIAIIKDAATLGGTINEKNVMPNDRTYTEDKLRDIGKDWEGMKDALDED